MMDRQVQQLVRLVDDLLDLSRIMQDKIELRKERVELSTVVARAVETAQPTLDAQGHELTVALPKESVWLEADPIRLTQVVSNLLNNAAKYTEKGGRIGLTAGPDGSEILVRVKDTGIGIEAGMLPRIFGSFVQVDRSLDRSQGGMGIGLTLVRKLVEMHGGSVSAASEGLGKGSEFVVRLPAQARIRQSGKQRAEDRETIPPSTASRLLILVVDDNRDAAESLAWLLGRQGHEVRVAHDGPTGLELAQSYHPDMAFLDIEMPGMDGCELCRRIRQQAALANMLVVALSGRGQEEDRRRSQEAGFDRHVVKPIEPYSLERLLNHPKVVRRQG